ncbi:Ca-activated chloride channel family protein [Mucilaginibacter frigoritolerans]|uniref:Ca-activated chloride channel family protein n=1 Tax=Mucilaginibacter frigoritolerans TaxID=652788 RepID=A0A562U0M4_9SPHI|nr:von Willebrand factor type A domain-containing protein [Mucilaginibacter frigoritolerans]TWI99389.1 Ca-activated chloride channel family protein [Mucilaginibacter frigoritolerans]
MKKIALLLLLFAGLTGFKPGNTRHIFGTVYDSNDKLPMPGVSVKIAGASTATSTDAAGHYSINTSAEKASLIFTFVGYESKTVAVGKADSINVYLEPSSQSLNEVMVIGYSSVRKQNITGSVATVSPTTVQTLQGKVAGISIRGNKAVAASPKYIAATPVNATDESYKPINENGFNDVKSNPLSTFSVDVDAASYSNVRRFINGGQLPPADAVRIEEMINYFKYDLPGPTGKQPVAIHTELSSAPWNAKHRLLRIALKAKTIDMDKLPPSNLVFLIDVSGSMDEANKLPLVKASMKMLVEQLRPKDKVAIVTYAGQAGVALASTAGNEKTIIDNAIDQLNANGSTAGGEGIKMAYRIAKENFMEKGNNRIIMATDGDFNVGPNSDEDMEQLIIKERESKVAISIVGYGMGNLKDSKMETLADKGNGNYAYIDNITEARKAFVTEFAGTLYTVAKDVKLQIEFNPAKVQAYRLLGYEDRMLNKEDFNNDRKDAGDIGSGHTVTALYEIVPAGIKDDYIVCVDPLKYQKNDAPVSENGSDEMMTIKFRYKLNDSASSKMSLITVKDQPVAFNAASADFRFAVAVAEFGMLLRNSEFKQQSNFQQAISIAKAAKGTDPDGYRSEFVRLAESAALLANSSIASE